MISITNNPPLVGITGNSLLFTLHSDNYLASAGSNSVNAITFTDTGQADDQMTLSWNGVDLVLVCSPSPDDSGNQLPDRSLFAALNLWVEAVGVAMGINYYLSRDFVITSNAGDLTLTAKQEGAVYDMAMTLSWNTPLPTIAVTPGVDKASQTFFKVGVIVEIYENSNYIPIAEELLPVDESGNVTFDIHKIFADRVYPDFTFPEASDDLMILQSNSSKPYRIRAYERYGDDLTAKMILESSQYHILLAGVSHLQEAIYNRQESSLWAKIQYNDYFLTWQPKTKIIDRYQTEKLFYLNQSTVTSLSIKIEINYNDETPQSTITKETVNSPTDKGVYECILSPNVLQLPGYDTGIIDNYRVWIEDNLSNRISEIRTYILDTEVYEKVRYFLFLNSMGGFDTLRIVGDQEDSLQYTRTSVSKILGDSFTEKDHKIKASDIRERKSYNANTGWTTEENLAWIRDFFLSKQVYLVNVGKLVPVEVTTTEALQKKDRVEMFSIQFEYHRAFTSEYYSKEIVTAQFTDAFNDDFANE